MHVNPITRVKHFAETQPSHLAIEESHRTLSYQDLEAQSSCLSSFLEKSGVQKGDRVGLLIDNSTESYTSILGIWKAGAAYVPISTSTPAERIAFILDDAQLKGVITLTKHIPLLTNASGFTQNIFAIDCMDLNRKPPSRSTVDLTGDELAYLIYTSGTTGRPKGVQITHANLWAFLEWVLPYFAFNSNDRFLGHARLSFDLSVYDTFVALAAGATLCPVTSAVDFAFPANLMASKKITCCALVPGLLQTLLQEKMITEETHPSLRMAISIGEALSGHVVALWHRQFSTPTLYNAYGPTEATVFCTVKPIQPNEEPPQLTPIGTPCGKMDSVVTKQGELVLSGPQLSPGYWRRDDLTAQKFFTSQADGRRVYHTGDLAKWNSHHELVWLGRMDHQVKIKGYRVELQEIESVILESQFASQAVAGLVSSPTHQRLVAVVTPSSTCKETNKDRIIENIFKYCKRFLPKYSIPVEIKIVDSLLTNLNGKIDRTLNLESYRLENS